MHTFIWVEEAGIGRRVRLKARGQLLEVGSLLPHGSCCFHFRLNHNHPWRLSHLASVSKAGALEPGLSSDLPCSCRWPWTPPPPPCTSQVLGITAPSHRFLLNCRLVYLKLCSSKIKILNSPSLPPFPSPSLVLWDGCCYVPRLPCAHAGLLPCLSVPEAAAAQITHCAMLFLLTFFFRFIYFVLCVWVLFECMFVHYAHAWCPQKSK